MGPGMMLGSQNQSMMMQMMGAGQNVTGSKPETSVIKINAIVFISYHLELDK